jgi:hypothetical protein
VKGHLNAKTRPSRRANYKRRNQVKLRRYRWFLYNVNFHNIYFTL